MNKKDNFNTIKYSQLSNMYLSANGFKLIFEEMKERYVAGIGSIQYGNIVPATATNGLFALELYLKFIYSTAFWEKSQRCAEVKINETQYPKGHKLAELYSLLDGIDKNNKIKEKIVEKIKESSNEISEDEVDAFFQTYSNDFAEWRYYFEKDKCMEGDFYLLRIILTALYNYCYHYVEFDMYTPEVWEKNHPDSSIILYKG